MPQWLYGLFMAESTEIYQMLVLENRKDLFIDTICTLRLGLHPLTNEDKHGMKWDCYLQETDTDYKSFFAIFCRATTLKFMCICV